MSLKDSEIEGAEIIPILPGFWTNLDAKHLNWGLCFLVILNKTSGGNLTKVCCTNKYVCIMFACLCKHITYMLGIKCNMALGYVFCFN